MITIHTSNQVYTNSLTPFIASYSNTRAYAYDKLVWNFGDSTNYIGLTANHIFESENVYTVTTTAVLSTGETETETVTVSAYDLIPNKITWSYDDYKTDFLNVGEQNTNPFKIDVFNDKKWSDGESLITVRLYCENSKGIPYKNEKNIFLKPNWRFYDVHGNVVGYLSLTATKLYAYLDGSDEIVVTSDDTIADSVFIGTSATNGFYFVDDVSTNSVDTATQIQPLVLTVTQNLSTVYSDQFVSIPYINPPILRKFLFILDREPTKLVITQDGFNNFNEIKYNNVRTPFNIKLADSSGNFLKTNPTVESANLSTYPLTAGFTNYVQLSSNYLDDLYFNLFSKELTSFGGYADGFFVSLSATTNSIQLTATANVYYTQNPLPILYGWASDINAGTLKKITNIKNFTLKYDDVTLPETVITVEHPYETSGVYSISMDNGYNAYAADADNSAIYKYNKNGDLLSTLDLTSYFTTISATSSPAQTVTDGAYLYVTLFDAGSALKIGLNDFGDITPINYSSNMYLSAIGENTIQPTAIEIANNDLLWISYTSELSSFLVTYDITDLSQKNVISFPQQQIIDIRTNRDGSKTYMAGYQKDAWILNICDNNLSATNFQILSASLAGGESQYLTLDEEQNVWLAYGNNNLLKYNTATSATNYYTLGGTFATGSVWGGISCDHFNYIWVIHQKDKRLYVFNSNNMNNIYYINLDPYQLESYKEVYGYGDWNGFNYYNKFGFGGSVVKVIRGLYGESEPFYLNPKTGKYSVSKINEGFDMKEHIKQFALTELFQNYSHFFDDFIGAIVGDDDSLPTSLGKSTYEKISNFILNNNDIDTCHISALKSICEFIGEEISKYSFTYPSSLKRLMNLLSIKQKKLWGDKYYTEELYDIIGTQLDISTYLVSAYPQTSILAVEKFNNYYSLIEPLYIDDAKTSVYPLSSYSDNWGWGLSIGEGLVEDYYDFYSINIPNKSTIYSILDFNNTFTTTSLSALSSYSDYIDDNKVVDHLLSYDLVAGLNLINN